MDLYFIPGEPHPGTVQLYAGPKPDVFSINLLQLLCVALLATTEVAGAQVVQLGPCRKLSTDCNPQAGFGYMNRNVQDNDADRFPGRSSFFAIFKRRAYMFWYDASISTLRQDNRNDVPFTSAPTARTNSKGIFQRPRSAKSRAGFTARSMTCGIMIPMWRPPDCQGQRIHKPEK